MKGRILLGTTLLAMALSACGRRWVPNAPFRLDAVAGRTEVAAICGVLVRRARALGYQVLSARPSRGFFRVPAFFERDVVHASYFSVQVATDGSVTISASGHSVRDRGISMHRGLFRELGHFAGELQQALRGR